MLIIPFRTHNDFSGGGLWANAGWLDNYTILIIIIIICSFFCDSCERIVIASSRLCVSVCGMWKINKVINSVSWVSVHKWTFRLRLSFVRSLNLNLFIHTAHAKLDLISGAISSRCHCYFSIVVWEQGNTVIFTWMFIFVWEWIMKQCFNNQNKETTFEITAKVM